MSTTNLLRLPAASKTFGMRRCAPCRRSSLAVRSAFEQSEGTCYAFSKVLTREVYVYVHEIDYEIDPDLVVFRY